MIRYQFYGSIPNEQLLTFYHKNEIACFVHTSEKEGLPIAVAEAESAGIPIIATDAGGTSELIDGNGILLPVNATPVEIADALLAILTGSKEDTAQLSRRSRQIWESKFNAEKNAKAFLDIIRSLEGPKIKHIVIITEGYPFTDNEKGFIESELKEIIKHYTVSIVACVNEPVDAYCEERAQKNLGGIFNISLQDNINVIPYLYKWNSVSAPYHFLKYCADERTRNERKEILRSKEKRLRRLWESSKFYSKALDFYTWFRRSDILDGHDHKSTLMYTYWNLQPTLGACLNRNKLDGVKVFTRAHGYDYQDEQWEKTLRKPFASTADRFLDKIIFVSQNGLRYYLEKMDIKDAGDKYRYSYLGTRDAGETNTTEWKETTDTFALKNDCKTIVSCAALIPLKRVDRLIDALRIVEKKRPELNLRWIHFGDGILRTGLEEYAENVLTEG